MFLNNKQTKPINHIDFILTPRSVSSTSNINHKQDKFKFYHVNNYRTIHPLIQHTYRMNEHKNNLSENYLKRFDLKLNKNYYQKDAQVFPSRTLKRYDSNKLNDIGKIQKQLTRSKSVSQIQQKSRIQILSHIKKTLEQGQIQQNSQRLFTETYKSNQLFKQNLSNRINKLEIYLTKIKRERQREKVKSSYSSFLRQEDQYISSGNIQQFQKQKLLPLTKTKLENKRLQNMKLLLQQLEQVKKEVFQLKRSKERSSLKKQQNLIQTNYFARNQLKPIYINPGQNRIQQHLYPSSVTKFKSKMNGSQNFIIENNQKRNSNSVMKLNQTIPLVNRQKISFTFGKKPQQDNFSSQNSKNASPILIID